MVLDIRKDLIAERKSCHGATSVRISCTGRPDHERSVPAAEDIAGPCSCSPTLQPNDQDVIDRTMPLPVYCAGQPRPIRVPCSACTFVSNNNRPLRRRPPSCAKSQYSFDMRHQFESKGAEDAKEIDEEPEAEDIAGYRRSDRRSPSLTPTSAVGHVIPIQPFRVACSACTSSMRPMTYGMPPTIVPKIKLNNKSRNKERRQHASPSTDKPAVITRKRTTKAKVATDSSLPDLAHSDNSGRYSYCLTRHQNSGWIVKADPDTEMVDSRIAKENANTEMVIDTEPAMDMAQDKVEKLRGKSQYESIAVRYQETSSCQYITDRNHQDIAMALHTLTAEESKPPHDCFVKRVERACAAKVTRLLPRAGCGTAGSHSSRICHSSRGAAQDVPSNSPCEEQMLPSSSSQICPSSRTIGEEQQQPSSSTASGRSLESSNTQAKLPASKPGVSGPTKSLPVNRPATYDDDGEIYEVSPPHAAAHLEAAEDIGGVQAQSNNTKKGVNKKANNNNNTHDCRLQPRHRDNACPTRVQRRQMLEKCGNGGKASSPVAALQKDSNIVASQRPASSLATSPSRGDGNQELCNNKQVRLSVEVFPSPSAPKGFGLKIVQHFPKGVHVDYVNGLGLSPRSFKTMSCDRCSSSSSLTL